MEDGGKQLHIIMLLLTIYYFLYKNWIVFEALPLMDEMHHADLNYLQECKAASST